MSKTRNKLKLTGLLLTVVMIVSLLGAFSLTVGAAEAVSYVDYIWSEESKTLLSETKSIDTYTEITTTTTEMTSGWYVVIGEVTVAERMTATGEVRLILADGAHLNASLGITVNEGNSLYIYGQSSNESIMGKLTAKADGVSAAIGGYYDTVKKVENHAGTIVINGGNINVSTSSGGAGIGSSKLAGGYQITINAGVVTATTDDYGAAIGSGHKMEINSDNHGTVHSICINGGTVTATSGAGGAAIGGGHRFDGGDITITGGTVTATSRYSGAAIGGGEEGDGGNITITGGKVTAINTSKSSSTGAGIGGGYRGSGGNITITGGNVTAVGGNLCAGIGGYANAGNIIITGGVINSTGNVRACGIGGGAAGTTGSIAILTNQVTITQHQTLGEGLIGFGEDSDGSGSSMLLDGNTVTVTGAFTLLTDYTLPEGYTLVISDGASLTIPAGVTFKLPGEYTLTNNGTINAAAGAVNCTAHKYVNGVCVCGLECKHEGGTATCKVKAVCTICGTSYGEFSLTNHSWKNGICNYGCNTTHTPHVWGDKNGICTVCGATCAHTGGTATCVAKAVCAHCGTSYGELGGHTYNTAGSCTVCGAACPHSSFTDGKCPCGLTGGYCGDVIWTYDEVTKAFAITGTGAMEDYNSYSDRPWDGSISENATSVTISEGVTRIGKRAFQNFRQITAVTVPASVESIGYCAFTACKAQSITFAEGSRLTAFDDFVFQGCTALKQITLPAGVTSVDSSVFSGCNALTDIFVEEGSTTLKDIDGVLYTADGTTLLRYPSGKDDTAFTTPAGVTTIGELAFHENVNLKTITLSEGVTTIGEDAFRRCLALETLNLPDSLTTMGWGMISSSEKLTSIALPETLTKIDGGAFAASSLTEIHIPKNVTTIGAYAFTESHNLTTVVIPQGVTTIGEEAFCWMKSLTTVTIPSSVTSIGRAAFKSCDKLTTINAPCNWDTENPLYTFDSTVAVIVGDHTPNADGYTDNGDGTHKATCTECGYEETSRPHTIENHACTDCGAMEIVVSFDAGDYEWKTGDTLYFCRVSGDNEWEEYAFTATVAGDGTVTWTPDRTLYWDGTGEHKLVVIYPDTGYVWDTWYVDEDQATPETLRKNDRLDAIWSGNPTTDTITFNLKHRMAKVTVNYEAAEGVTISKAEVYTLTQYVFFDVDTLERRNIAWEEGDDLWINSYHNGNQFTAFVSPDAYAADGNFIKITLSDGSVREVKMNKAVTFEEGAEYTYTVVITADGAYLTCADECSFEYTANEDGLTHSKTCSKCGYVAASENHTLTYTTNGNVITATCSAKCGYVCTATVSAANTTYNGTEQKTATVTYSEGWTGGELTVSYANNVNAGTATASITLGEATASVEFTIAKADSTLTAPNAITDLVYNGSNQSLVSAGSSTTGTVQYKLNDGEWSTNVPTATEAGEYTVYYQVVGNENHNNVEPVSLTLEIAQRDFSDSTHNVSAVLDAESFVYDGTEKKPAVTVTIEKDKDWLVTADNYIVSYSENVNAGTATVTITGTGTNCTGTITKTFKITKAPLTVTAENKTMTTGQSLPPFTYTITGFVNGETEAVLTAKPTVSCEADGQTAGTYNITTSGAVADNYEITYVNGTLSVVDHQHAWTYTADGDTLTATCATAATCPLKTATIKIAAEGKTYDGTPVTATLTGSIDGVVNPTVSYSGNTDAGTHTASITLGKATASVEFTIAKADSTLTAPNAITDLVYNGSNQALVSAGSSTTGTVQYKLNDGEWSTNVPTATEAGEYTVYYKLVGDKNHKDVAEASVKVAILSKSAANAEVSFNGNLVYDGNAKTPEITVVLEQKELVPMKDYIVSCSNNVNAGTAAIEITFIGNYEGKVVKSFTIAPRQLVIFWENTNMIYNGNRQTPTAKLFGVIPGDEVGYTVSGWGKFGGTYTAKVEKLTNPNYVLPADATCRFTIDANPIEVAIDVAVDIYDIIPDSAKEAVADAAINAAENALNDAKNASTECINSAVDQITDCVSTKAQEAANTAKSLADALCELWQNLCSRVSCFF